MQTVDATITVHARADAAYHQWSRLEDFPRFVQGLESVHRRDPRRVHWRAEAWGHPIEWEAEIIEALPGRLFAWQSTDGIANSGRVQFQALDDSHTRIAVHIAYEPSGALQHIASDAGLAQHRLETELGHFKHFLESGGRHAGP